MSPYLVFASLERPDVTAIAAQRPSGTPNQGQPTVPQQPLQGYPNPYPTPTPPAPTGPPVYAIPQPTNSGSVDLSNIKPVNSGSVSLADAVARARGIAAEKGVSYDGRRNGSKSLAATLHRTYLVD